MTPIPDHRQYAPATERNRESIASVLAAALPEAGTILEIASGTGQHAAFFAPRFAPRHWLPSDPNPTARRSIESWRLSADQPTLHPPLEIDVTQGDWPERVKQWQRHHPTVPPLRAAVNINMIHISPWAACEGLFAGAAQLLQTEGDVLYIYGPFMQDGQHTAPSNEAFDRSLRSQNPEWGVRDMAAVAQVAQAQGFELRETIAMPANNFSLIFKRVSRSPRV